MAMKVQLVLFCMVFISLLALSECNESSIGETSTMQSNVVESLRVKNNVHKLRDDNAGVAPLARIAGQLNKNVIKFVTLNDLGCL
ncbi:hypothetical protein Pyn_24912 [Prunus yedoensis var. nudiflora]|uniref:Uncharacterized protein n=1 Tax=Prunus yedoensis var. nudiflora TaxID=2094558 RepID=A0A314XMA1_PRUYE|nr:hypothetical protein Pyn_24912 [Prunus yedoensis var. nudiflora]